MTPRKDGHEDTKTSELARAASEENVWFKITKVALVVDDQFGWAVSEEETDVKEFHGALRAMGGTVELPVQDLGPFRDGGCLSWSHERREGANRGWLVGIGRRDRRRIDLRDEELGPCWGRGTLGNFEERVCLRGGKEVDRRGGS